MLQETLKQRIFYIICAAFIVLNGVAVLCEFPWLNLLPFLLLFSFLIVFRLDVLLFILCFMVPLSVNIDDVGFGLGISIPDEPLIMLIMALAVFKFIIHSEYDYRVFRHPISVAVLINLAWVLITCFASEHPFVSFKYFLSRFWFVVVFYFLGVVLFRKFSNIPRYLWLYIIPLCVVVIYSLVKHSAFNFSQIESFTIQQPFYVGHGVYAAAIALVLPPIFLYLIYPKVFGVRIVVWPVIFAILVLLLTGLFYSYTRAAWISIVAAVAALVPLMFRIRLGSLIMMFVTAAVIGLLFSSQLIYLMTRNQDVSSKDFSEHLNSISNIKTDASNAERINRWVCAIEMFKERPVFGWGPGTYKFEYAPFQLAKYRTVISTDFGDGGNSHSEYLNPLCEMGALGFITLLYLFYQVLNTGFNLFYTARKPRVRLMALGILLGMITYFVHGLMNNYSETDKIAVLFWGGFAMLTAMDLYHNPKKAPATPAEKAA
jgi:putative inorganic carbon (HCO3(-)) transporter